MRTTRDSRLASQKMKPMKHMYTQTTRSTGDLWPDFGMPATAHSSSTTAKHILRSFRCFREPSCIRSSSSLFKIFRIGSCSFQLFVTRSDERSGRDIGWQRAVTDRLVFRRRLSFVAHDAQETRSLSNPGPLLNPSSFFATFNERIHGR